MESAFLGVTNDINVVAVDNHEAISLEDLFTDDIHIQTVYRTIVSYLFGTGFVLKLKKSNRIDDSPYNKGIGKLIKEKWEPFSKAALAHLMTFGYVVYRLVTHYDPDPLFDGQPIIYPVVVQRHHYDIRIITGADFSIRYLLYSKKRFLQNALEPDPHLRIFFNAEPNTVNGMHKSIVATLSTSAYRKALLDRFFLTAVEQRSRPPVIVARDTEAGRNVEQPYLQMSSIESIVPALGGAPNETVQFSGSAASAVLRPLNDPNADNGDPITGMGPYAMIYDTENAQAFNRKRRRVELIQSINNNVHVLGNGYMVSAKQPDLADPQKTIIEYSMMSRDETFALCQVPVGLAYPNSSATSKASTHIDDSELQRFARTLIEWQRIQLTLFRLSYSEAFEIAELDIDVDLPLIPNAKPTQILTFMNQNVIEDEYAKSLLLDITGIPRSKLFKGSNANDRPPIGGNENMTDPLIKQKIGVMKSEENERNAKAEQIRAEIKGENGDKELEEAKMKLEDKKLECALRKIEAEIHKAEVMAQIAEKSLKVQTEAKKQQDASQVKVNKSVKVQPKSTKK